jgi:hypothetical protein
MGAPLKQTQALLTNIRLGLKSLQEKTDFEGIKATSFILSIFPV